MADEEIADLVPAELNISVPQSGCAPGGVRVLVEGVPSKRASAQSSRREVRRHPVHQHTDAMAVQRVDERAEIVGSSRNGRSANRTRSPGSPTSRVGVLRHRHQLHVGETQVVHVLGERLGHTG